jgi:hypothetical protein
MPNVEIQINTFQVTSVLSAGGSTTYIPINSSAQVGDIIYYATESGGILSDTTQAGEIIGFNSSGYIEADIDDAIVIPSGAFILFSKRIEINESSVKGYYADVTLENHSNKRAELFALSSEIVPSSK